MEYKKIYTKAELNEILAWAKAHENELPEEYDLAPGVHINSMHDFLFSMDAVIAQHAENPTYGANIRFLFMLREKFATLGKDEKTD